MTIMKTGPRDEELERHMADAIRAYAGLNPVDRALHDAEQRRSWVRGQMSSEPPRDVLADEVVRLRALLAERDDFIVRCGLWHEFVESLPAKLHEAREG